MEPGGATLRELVAEALGPEVAAALADAENADAAITGVAQHSGRVEPGFVFVARPGERVDGHRFVRLAVDRGAVAVVGELAGVRLLPWKRTPYLRVPDAKRAVARLAAALHGFPSRQLTVAGITGTDGKTTTSFLLHHLLQATTGTGLLSTAAVRVGAEALPLDGHFTTPEAPEVQALLARFVSAGLSHAVVESSSHGLAQRRLDEVEYALAVWTNLSPEHLDFHGTLERYEQAKLELVRRAPRAVLNRDDAAFERFREASAEAISYGRHRQADWRATRLRSDAGRLRFELHHPHGSAEAELPLVGRYNVHNALAALAAAAELGVPLDTALARLAAFEGVPGRMQLVQAEPFALVVDFAHTAPALAKALTALREHAPGRLIVVVGAAGERDPGKRAPLARAATDGADLAIFTEEDHRSEPLEEILAAMAAGAEAGGAREGRDFMRVPSRRDAIRYAVAAAEPGDVVLLAGKGHEATLERGDETLAWDEVAEARRALALEGG